MTEGLMKTTNRISTAAFLAAASLTYSSSVWALGLGDVTVESFLNQPLQVRIDLVTRETDNLAAVTARLASADDYELIGASREAVPVPIRFSVEDPEGEPYLLGTSKLPIGNPVVRLIVEVNYASGRLLREYTVFLDPPTHAASAPIPRVDKRNDPPMPESAAVTAEPEATQAAPAAQPAASTARREPSQDEYGPVGNGETLWAIARNWSSGTGLDINRVMIAIQRENPEAFMRGNINLLKRGAILRMPQADEVRNISTASAFSEVSEQIEQFEGSKGSITAASTSIPLLAEERDSFAEAETETAVADAAGPVAKETVAETVEEAVEDQQEALAEPSIEESIAEGAEPLLQDQLELVPPSEANDLDSAYGFEESENETADASVAATSLREDLARTEEDLITQQQQNDYLEERIKELEAQLVETQSGNVNDSDLANMEDRLRQERVDQADEKSWFSGFSAWLVGLLVILAAGGGWLLSRRGSARVSAPDQPSEDEQLQEIKDEAKEVLRVLEDSNSGSEEVAEAEVEAANTEAVDDEAAGDEVDASAAKQYGTSGDDAEVLDEESSDPEIQLDLARAYISMGDKEAARVILEEVGSNGNETQREEAKKMLDLLVS
jgi:FimV-like protein